MKSKEEIEYRKRLEILENHLGSDFYKIGQYHMNISDRKSVV